MDRELTDTSHALRTLLREIPAETYNVGRAAKLAVKILNGEDSGTYDAAKLANEG
jgi:hypothetical protein